MLYVWRELRGDVRATNGRIDDLGRELRAELAAQRAELRTVSERLARLEGAAFGPWPTRPDPEPTPRDGDQG